MDWDGWRRYKEMLRRQWEGWRAKLRDIPGTNMQLARYHLAQGNFTDAAMRFKLVLWMQAKNADAWAGLGEARLRAGEGEQAEKALTQALRLDPSHADARRLLTELHQPDAA